MNERINTYILIIFLLYLVRFIIIIELKRALGSKVKQKIQIHNQDKDARVLSLSHTQYSFLFDVFWVVSFLLIH